MYPWSIMTEEKQEYIEAVAREMKKELPKLVLWYTPDSKPLLSQSDLEPIMEILGFVPIYPSPESINISRLRGVLVTWMEYKYCGVSTMITARKGAFRRSKPLETPPPTPKLPYPPIDGLHLFTYRAFLEAVDFYLINRCSRDIFHLQGIPVNVDYPRLKYWSYADESSTLYRNGTLVDEALKDRYSDDITDFMSFKVFPRVNEDFVVDDDPEITMAPIDDIIVTNHHQVRQQ